MKSPAKLKEDLKNAVSNIQLIQKYLKTKSDETIAGIGTECSKTSDLLETILKNNKIPEFYRVAVVGRFKAGKSSFVNELLESKLAGEDTSPETAAVTTFIYGTKIEAKINLIDKTSWNLQKNLFREDPKNIDAQRVKIWESFSRPRKNADGIEENFDLMEIETSLLKNDKNEVTVTFDTSGAKGAEKSFRDQLKLYTSGSKPYHCLVSSINISCPSSLLKDGIELIDTPGLDDTERFRVSLTEQSVENVDAILFLTKSGGAYGQSEKDFLLSLLRKGTVKQLMIVITQVDQTYEQHIKSAEDNEEEPQTISQRISLERSRIREEIKKTLDELAGEDSLATRAYIEQFSNVEVVFTSVMAHRAHKAKKSPTVSINSNDPGGLSSFKNQLSGVLSTESRMAISAGQILAQSKGALDQLSDAVEAKISALKNTKNREEVERRLNSFRDKFTEICKGTADELKEAIATYKGSNEIRLSNQKNNIENIILKAGRELNKFRTIDVGRHWRTRRNSNWGYMYELQSRVANRIFPAVQEMLESHIEDFSTYVKRHERKISKLTKDAVAAALELQLGEFANFDIRKKLKESTNKILEKAQEQIESEQEQIIKLLDSFITEDVEKQISEKRAEVANIWGRGTTSGQQAEVNKFYDAIENILSEALLAHITQRNSSFSLHLVQVAEHAPKETFQEIDVQLGSALENLSQAAEMTIKGQKEEAEKLLNKIASKANTTNEGIASLLLDLNERPDIDENIVETEKPISVQTRYLTVESPDLDWTDELLHKNTNLFVAHILKDGDINWPYSRIFNSIIFKNVEKIRLIDPYLFKSHQIRNLKELLLYIAENSKPKFVEIFTSPFPLERQEYNQKYFNDLVSSIFSEYGISLELKFHHNLHDRYIFLDSGYVAKLGRGLDFYKPSVGLAAHRQESRKVRACEISIFSKGID
jgi:predicted GTPase